MLKPCRGPKPGSLTLHHCSDDDDGDGDGDGDGDDEDDDALGSIFDFSSV